MATIFPTTFSNAFSWMKSWLKFHLKYQIWWNRRSWSTLAQIMAYCLAAPSYHPNQCWLLTSRVRRNSPDGNLIGNTWEIFAATHFKVKHLIKKMCNNENIQWPMTSWNKTAAATTKKTTKKTTTTTKNTYQHISVFILDWPLRSGVPALASSTHKADELIFVQFFSCEVFVCYSVSETILHGSAKSVLCWSRCIRFNASKP